jgi:hypothetical protein
VDVGDDSSGIDTVLAQISLRLAIGFVIAGASAELASAQALPEDAGSHIVCGAHQSNSAPIVTAFILAMG